MGRYVKNRELRSGSYSIRLPYTTPLIGAECPVEGLVRYNYIDDAVELYRNGKWVQFQISDEDIPNVKDTFIGDGILTEFGPMTYEYKPGEELRLFVYVQNVWQNPNVNYEVDGFFINMASPVPNGHSVVILHGVD